MAGMNFIILKVSNGQLFNRNIYFGQQMYFSLHFTVQFQFIGGIWYGKEIYGLGFELK